MTAPAFITRRMLLKDMGKAGLAMMLLGTAACSPDETGGSSTTAIPGNSSTTPSGSTTEGNVATTTIAAVTTTSAEAGQVWHRVNLDFVSAYIVYRGGEAAIVDTGVAGSETAIEIGLGEIGLGWGDVAHVIATHKHPDHIGSLEAVIAATGAPWYAGAADIPAISASAEGTPLANGATIFGLQTIETPGHTPGHISMLDTAAGVLIAGDALNGSDGGVAGPNAQFSEDIETANLSVQDLASFDYEVALFGHGEPLLAGASTAVADLAASLG
ncbi:MAG TPA: MBL fold metallo-hydrolase [Acidimicrobiia bacterium]|nr:MBL fold metallo-hydrolase [Acidimicrobiia bacterium]